VEVRERIAFDEPAVRRALRELGLRFPCCEVVLISTCNRMEFYFARPVHGHPRLHEVLEFISTFHDVPMSEFAPHLYHREDVEAVRHLFRVVSSLDSMVLGESQIAAQAKQAFDLAREAGVGGKRLETLFQRAFAASKDVRTHTGVAAGRLSVGSTAVDLARQIFSSFSDKVVMMVGAGKMGELTLTHLLETQPKSLLVTNRTDERAVALAERISQRHGVAATAVPFAQWVDRLRDVDIVISSTGAREPILTPAKFKPVYAKRSYRPLLLIDIAVPRDIDPQIESFESVYLYNIDHLQSVVELNLAQRRESIARCHQMIEEAVVEFVEKQSRADIAPTIAALQDRLHGIGRQELERLWPRLDSASPRDRELIEELLHRVTQKILHGPLSLLNDKSANGAARVYADTLRAMFNLSEKDETVAAMPREKTGK